MSIARVIAEAMQKSSWIRKMFEEGAKLKEEHGVDKVHDFSLGNPEIEPPENFLKTFEECAAERTPGLHRYMQNSGYPWVREKIAAAKSEESGIDIPWQNIIMNVGAGGALNVFFKAVCDPGDEIIIIAPFFVEYLFYISNHGGVPKVCESNPDFSLNLENIEAAINEKTKAIILNTPNNPTGVLYPESQLKEVGELLARKEKELGKDIYLISDEPYKRILFDGEKHAQFLRVYENAIVVHSHSKDLGLPGERIGTLTISPNCTHAADLIGATTFAIRTLGFVNAPALHQRAVADHQATTIDPMIYQKKRDMICAIFDDAGIEYIRPKGAFYIFPKSPIEDDVQFVRSLQKHFILAVPGTGFGRGGHIRMAYCVSDAHIEGARDGFMAATKEARG
ncbi:MAG: pyridoxal phosphate-dependent aminotransferase [Planctomycetota bacterium]|nr:MAG: pyridoxal phosphate-dependent aminotransferase [Planctomycetota bacterium]